MSFNHDRKTPNKKDRMYYGKRKIGNGTKKNNNNQRERGRGDK